MFRLYSNHQGAYCMCFAKVIIVKQSVKIHHYGISLAVWLHIYPVLVGVRTVHCAEYMSIQSLLVCLLYTMQSAYLSSPCWCVYCTPCRVHIYPVFVGVCTVRCILCMAYCTHTNKDWIDMQPHSQIDSIMMYLN